MEKPPAILEYARPSQYKFRPVCGFAAASMIGTLLYLLICQQADFDPWSLRLDTALNLPTHSAFPVKAVIFGAFPFILISLALFSIRRIRSRAGLTGISVACASIVLNLWIAYWDLSRLWDLYRPYY